MSFIKTYEHQENVINKWIVKGIVQPKIKDIYIIYASSWTQIKIFEWNLRAFCLSVLWQLHYHFNASKRDPKTNLYELSSLVNIFW